MEDLYDTPSGAEHRLRLRPWLESMLDSGTIPGLEWLDQGRCFFKIPWKHRSKKDWDRQHIKVFMEWAKHTGKFREGDEPDYVAMKTRLRCAFNKAPDIEEVKRLHSLKSSEPYKVYCFTPRQETKPTWSGHGPSYSSNKFRICTVSPMVQKQVTDNGCSSSGSDGSSSGDEAIKKQFLSEDSIAADNLTLVSSGDIAVLAAGNGKMDRRRRKRKSRPRRYSASDAVVEQLNGTLPLEVGKPPDGKAVVIESQATLDAAEVLLAFKDRQADVYNPTSPQKNLDNSLTNNELLPSLLRKPTRFPSKHDAELWMRNIMKLASHAASPLQITTGNHNPVIPPLSTNKDGSTSVINTEDVAKQADVIGNGINHNPQVPAQTIPDIARKLSMEGLDPADPQLKQKLTILGNPSIVNSLVGGDIAKMGVMTTAPQTLLVHNAPVTQQLPGGSPLNVVVSGGETSLVRDRMLGLLAKRQNSAPLLPSATASVSNGQPQLPSPPQFLSLPADFPDQLKVLMAAGTVGGGLNSSGQAQGPMLISPELGLLNHRGRPKTGKVRYARVINNGSEVSKRALKNTRTLKKRAKTLSGTTFTNNGNIMTAGLAYGKPVVRSGMQSAVTMAEETMRMRAAYGVAVTVTSGAGGSNFLHRSSEKVPELVPAKANGLSNGLSPKSTKSEGASGKSIVSGEKRENDGDGILDLRMTPESDKHGLSEIEDGMALDLRVYSDTDSTDQSPKSESALDLTLKRKIDNEDDVSQKRWNRKELSMAEKKSLAISNIWDLSKEQKPPKLEECPAAEATATCGGDVKESEPIELVQDIEVKQEERKDEEHQTTSSDTLTLGAELEIQGQPQPMTDATTDSDVGKDAAQTTLRGQPSRQKTDDTFTAEGHNGKDAVTSLPTVVSSQREKAEDMTAEMEEVRAIRHLIQMQQQNQDNSIPSEEAIQEALRQKQRKSDTNSRKAQGAATHHHQPKPATNVDNKKAANPTALQQASVVKMSDANSRQRLRPWLESQINSGQIRGLQWIDREQMIFKVPWKHGGKHDWTSDDSRLFMEWARHTGRYREGIDEEMYATWKTRLRCAFNKAPDIEEIKDKTDLAGPEPYRVYRLKPKTELPKHKANHLEDDPDSRPVKRQGNLPVVPVVVDELSNYNTRTLADASFPNNQWDTPLASERPRVDLLPAAAMTTQASGSTSPLLPPTTSPTQLLYSPADEIMGEPVEEIEVTTDQTVYPNSNESYYLGPPVNVSVTSASYSSNTTSPFSNLDTSQQSSVATSPQTYYVSSPPCAAAPIVPIVRPLEGTSSGVLEGQIHIEPMPHVENDGMTVELKLKAQTTRAEHIPNGESCCVASKNDEQSNAEDMEANSVPRNIWFPNRVPGDQSISPENTNKINALLPYIHQGITFTTSDGDILATRNCRCGVHYISGSTGGNCVKLKVKEENVKIFDFEGYFMPALSQYQSGEGPMPSAEVHLLFGQVCHRDELDEQILISMTVTSNRARQQLESFMGTPVPQLVTMDGTLTTLQPYTNDNQVLMTTENDVLVEARTGDESQGETVMVMELDKTMDTEL